MTLCLQQGSVVSVFHGRYKGRVELSHRVVEIDRSLFASVDRQQRQRDDKLNLQVRDWNGDGKRATYDAGDSFEMKKQNAQFGSHKRLPNE